MGDIANKIDNHQNAILVSNSTIVSIGLTKAGYKVDGILVTPSVWILSYSVQGNTPDKIDIGLYEVGFFSVTSSVVAIGGVRTIVDDDIDTKL